MKELSKRNIACCNVRELLVNFLVKMEVTGLSRSLSEEDFNEIFAHVKEEFDSTAADELLDAVQVYMYAVNKEQ